MIAQVVLLVGYTKGVAKGESVPSSGSETVPPTPSPSGSFQLWTFQVPGFTGRAAQRLAATASNEKDKQVDIVVRNTRVVSFSRGQRGGY